MDDSSSFQSLQEQYEITKKELGKAEKTLKRITGKDHFRRAAGRPPGFTRRKFNPDVPRGRPFIPQKRPLFPTIKFMDDEQGVIRQSEHSPVKKPNLQSTAREIKSTSREITSREIKSTSREIKSTSREIKSTSREIKIKESINDQNEDSKMKDRNRRMFGNLLGTLKKFQSEETGRKEQVQKKADIERRLEVKAEEEKERAKKEKFELFNIKKEKQVQLRCLEKKMEIAESYEAWEKSIRSTIGYIRTLAEPDVFYLPGKLTADTKKKLEESTAKTLELIEEKKAKLLRDLAEVEEWYRKDDSLTAKENFGLENPNGDSEAMKVSDQGTLEHEVVDQAKPAWDQIVNIPEKTVAENDIDEEEFPSDVDDDIILISDDDIIVISD